MCGCCMPVCKKTSEDKNPPLPIRPYQGIYGIKTRKQLEEAKSLMGFTTAKVCETFNVPGKMLMVDDPLDGSRRPYIIWYGGNSCRWMESMSAKEFRRYSKADGIVRVKGKIITLFWGRGSSHKCATLEMARAAAKKNLKGGRL